MGDNDYGRYKEAIRAWGGSIYDPIEIGDPTLWIPTPALEALLDEGLRGTNLVGLPLRTRSKVVKIAVCKALGYPVPKSFKKSKPRFPGQQFDTYTQKSTNLQVWNEELEPNRRYAVIRVSGTDVVDKVKIVNGLRLAALDTTGTITTKYQAQYETRADKVELISLLDQPAMLSVVRSTGGGLTGISPSSPPTVGALMPVAQVFEKLSGLVGRSFADPGSVQDRNRGGGLHKLVCEALGYDRYDDSGQFPDVCHQLLEVKLQTSPTIDLGLVLPDSTKALGYAPLGTHHPRHCDTRYAVFYGRINGNVVTLTHFVLATGGDFFTRFRRFEGKVRNGKLQIPLPADFFGTT